MASAFKAQAQPCSGSLHDVTVFPSALHGKRVLLCTESFGPVNGVSRTTLMLVTHLRAHGVQVAVVAPHNHTKHDTFVPSNAAATGVNPAQMNAAAKNVEFRIHGYPLPFNPELSIAYPVRLSTLYANTFGEPPDIIYLASPASLGFQVMSQLRQQHPANQLPIICNFQTDLAGYCAILFPYPLGDLAVFAFARVQSFLFRHSSVKTIFYPSTFVRRYLEQHGVPDTKLKVLRRGVNTDLFNPAKRSYTLRKEIAPHDEIILICVARLAAEKGFGFLARVATELRVRGLRFKLYIVGGNKEAEVEGETKALFSHAVLDGSVIFAGFKVGEALAEAYASADLFLHCSITETFGLVVLESMASGVPVIARDEGGPSDTINHGISGLLVPPSDLSGFVDQVILLANNDRLRHSFGEQARAQACEATWANINNKVAWEMVDVIEKHDENILTRRSQTENNSVVGAVSSIFGWLLARNAVKQTVVESRLVAALGIITGFWGLIGIYIVFTKITRWSRSHLIKQLK